MQVTEAMKSVEVQDAQNLETIKLEIDKLNMKQNITISCVIIHTDNFKDYTEMFGVEVHHNKFAPKKKSVLTR